MTVNGEDLLSYNCCLMQFEFISLKKPKKY